MASQPQGDYLAHVGSETLFATSDGVPTSGYTCRAAAAALRGQGQFTSLKRKYEQHDWTRVVRIVPSMPSRSVLRSGETKLVVAVLEDAAFRCARLAEFEATGVVTNPAHAPSASLRAETAEMRAWIAADMAGAEAWSFPLGYCCEVLSVTQGYPWRREAVAEALTAILEGRTSVPRGHRSNAKDAGKSGRVEGKRRSHGGRTATRVAA